MPPVMRPASRPPGASVPESFSTRSSVSFGSWKTHCRWSSGADAWLNDSSTDFTAPGLACDAPPPGQNAACIIERGLPAGSVSFGYESSWEHRLLFVADWRLGEEEGDPLVVVDGDGATLHLDSFAADDRLDDAGVLGLGDGAEREQGERREGDELHSGDSSIYRALDSVCPDWDQSSGDVPSRIVTHGEKGRKASFVYAYQSSAP